MESFDTKEVGIVKTQVTKGFNAATAAVITTDEEMLKAGELRANIRKVAKLIDNSKTGMTKPINEGLKKIREFFRPLEDKVAEAESIVTNKMLAYQKEQDEKRKKAENEANERILAAQKEADAGKITEKAAEKVMAKEEKKLEKVPEVIKKSETFHTRKVPSMRIVDENLIPREYLMVDEVKLRKAVLAGTIVAGAEYYEKETLV